MAPSSVSIARYRKGSGSEKKGKRKKTLLRARFPKRRRNTQPLILNIFYQLHEGGDQKKERRKTQTY